MSTNDATPAMAAQLARVGLGADEGHRETLGTREGLTLAREVSTVGDLTAKHIGQLVRVGGAKPALLHSISAHGRYGMRPEIIISTGMSGGFYITIDTPCEVVE